MGVMDSETETNNAGLLSLVLSPVVLKAMFKFVLLARLTQGASTGEFPGINFNLYFGHKHR